MWIIDQKARRISQENGKSVIPRAASSTNHINMVLGLIGVEYIPI